MWFIVIGVAMLVMNFLGIGPVGEWTWAEKWRVMLSPFGLALIWWWWSDASGRTTLKEMEKIDDKREARRQKNLELRGLNDKNKKKH